MGVEYQTLAKWGRSTAGPQPFPLDPHAPFAWGERPYLTINERIMLAGREAYRWPPDPAAPIVAEFQIRDEGWLQAGKRLAFPIMEVGQLPELTPGASIVYPYSLPPKPEKRGLTEKEVKGLFSFIDSPPIIAAIVDIFKAGNVLIEENPDDLPEGVFSPIPLGPVDDMNGSAGHAWAEAVDALLMSKVPNKYPEPGGDLIMYKAHSGLDWPVGCGGEIFLGIFQKRPCVCWTQGSTWRIFNHQSDHPWDPPRDTYPYLFWYKKLQKPE